MHTVGEAMVHLFPDAELREKAHAVRAEMDYRPFVALMAMEPGLIPFLEFIKSRCRTAISTNRTYTIQYVLEYHRLKPYFDLVVSSSDVEFPKPHPQSLKKIMDHFGVDPENCLYVGDSEVDLETARRAGVPMVLYKNPQLDGPIPVDHVESFSELQTLIQKTFT
jgi:HAD superfamily hydrolase (TIGR01549 family)